MTSRGTYRSIYVVLVDGPDYQALPPHAKLVLLTLKLSLGPSGIDILYPTVLEPRTGLSSDQVALSLDILEHAGWLQREKNVVWIVDGLRYEPSFTLTNVNHRSAILDHLKSLPRLSVIAKFKSYSRLDKRPRRHRQPHGMGDGIRDGMGDQGKEKGKGRGNRETEKEKQKKTRTAARKRAALGEHSAFDDAWKLYPRRSGSNPKLRAQRAWSARIAEGVSPDDMLAGLKRYVSHCEAEHKIGTPYVLQAATFFGPEKRFAEPWESSNGRPDDGDSLVAEELAADRATQELLARRRGHGAGNAP